MVLISPSILNADFSKLGLQVKELEACGADLIHIDVMDGVFVPNISFGMPIAKAVKDSVTVPLDVHLMITEPEKYVDAFIDAGADYITFHPQATTKTLEILKHIKSRGVKCGIAINPDICLNSTLEFLPHCDILLIMSVFAGFGGQSFIEESVEKIRQAAALKAKYNPNMLIEVDGGINEQNASKVVEAGVNVIVAGSSVVNAKDKADMIKALRGE